MPVFFTVGILDFDILRVGNMDVNILNIGNMDVDILRVGNMDVGITVCKACCCCLIGCRFCRARYVGRCAVKQVMTTLIKQQKFFDRTTTKDPGTDASS
jgi:hypothetical protein